VSFFFSRDFFLRRFLISVVDSRVMQYVPSWTDSRDGVPKKKWDY